MPRSVATAANYGLGPADLAQAVTNCVKANQPAMIWGPPGIGKSAVCEQVADSLGLTYLDVRVLLLDPVDLRGIPYRDETNRTQWAPPAFLPPEGTTDGYLLGLEELPAGPPMVQAALYQLIYHPRRLGEYKLPENVRIVASGNREEDRAVSRRMGTALASRFTHLDARIDADAWIDWALGPGKVALPVIFFLKYRPELMHVFDPRQKELAFPCPRTWAMVGQMIDNGFTCQSMADLAVLRGTVGEGAAIELAAFLEVHRDLPMPETVFADPHNVRLPEKADALMMLSAALAGNAEPDKMDAMEIVAKRLPRVEVAEFMMNAAVKINPDSRYEGGYARWASYISKL